MIQGELLRDEGIAKVSSNNSDWLKRCIALARHIVSPSFTAEDIRLQFEKLGLIPTHPNAWGALTNSLVKRGIIKKTGQYRQMKDPRSHARETAVYTKA